jgi:hypothetical protein
MNSQRTDLSVTERRSMLMAELLFQDLGASFVARPDSDSLPFDFLVGFSNPNGGTNTFAVELKGTEKPVKGQYVLKSRSARAFANSNIPVIFLVVDSKQNQSWYAWGHEIGAQIPAETTLTSFPVTLRQITADEMQRLKEELVGVTRKAS